MGFALKYLIGNNELLNKDTESGESVCLRGERNAFYAFRILSIVVKKRIVKTRYQPNYNSDKYSNPSL